MDYRELKNLITKIVGLRLTVIGYACNMPMFNFENKAVSYALHTQCFTRIIKNNDILVTTQDFQSWDGVHEENNDFLFNLKKFKSKIEGGLVISVEINTVCDVIITLDNDIIIQVFIQNSYSNYGEEWEQYRFFEVSKDDDNEHEKLPPHYVVYSKHIEICD